MNSLGEFLREKRDGLSLRDFAQKCNISHTHLDSIEKGVDPRTGKPVRITTETLKSIADGLQVSYLFLASLAEDAGEEYNTVVLSPAENKLVARRLQALLDDGMTKQELFCDHMVQPETITQMLSGEYAFTIDVVSQLADFSSKPLEYFISGAEEKPTAAVGDELNIDTLEYALYGEARDLDEDEKQQLLELAKLMRRKRNGSAN